MFISLINPHWITYVYSLSLPSLSRLALHASTGKMPQLHELEDLGDNSLNIIGCVHQGWQRLRPQFFLPSYTADAVRGMSSKDACREVFARWLDGEDGGRSPKTWNTIIKVLNRTGHGALAAQVKDTLMVQRQLHELKVGVESRGV